MAEIKLNETLFLDDHAEDYNNLIKLVKFFVKSTFDWHKKINNLWLLIKRIELRTGGLLQSYADPLMQLQLPAVTGDPEFDEKIVKRGIDENDNDSLPSSSSDFGSGVIDPALHHLSDAKTARGDLANRIATIMETRLPQIDDLHDRLDQVILLLLRIGVEQTGLLRSWGYSLD